MRIRWKKTSSGPVLSVIRKDGSVEVFRASQGEFFLAHDLLHWAVESTLGFDKAFWGLLESGWKIETFADKTDPRYRNLPQQAIVAEHIVNILSRQALDPARKDPQLAPLWREEINDNLASALAADRLSPTPISLENLLTIAEMIGQQLKRYGSLPTGEHLEVPFPAALSNT